MAQFFLKKSFLLYLTGIGRQAVFALQRPLVATERRVGPLGF